MSWRDWNEDEVIVFSQGLGHSLLLSAAGAQVLRILAQAAPHPLSLSQLVTQMLEACEPDTASAAVMAVLEATLPEFQRIGLAITAERPA